MFLGIKNRVESELKSYIRQMDKTYRLSRLSPVLYNNIKEFVSREGKRVRPILFCIGYLGYSGRPAPGLYRSAVSLELLHDFMLVHDDIIDKSRTRRGKPSMHELLNRYLAGRRRLKFDGEDLTIVIGDVLYAMALDSFLAVKEKPQHKEAALKKLVSAALYTGSGEFIELLLGAKPIDKVTRQDIYKIYDYKTANYTFASPLTIGATLAGVSAKELNLLYNYGMLLGRAFQIKDDIIGVFGKFGDTGKSNLTDLAEEKRTILIWHAFHSSNSPDKAKIKNAFSGRRASPGRLREIRDIIKKAGALDYAGKEINSLLESSRLLLKVSRMKPNYKAILKEFSARMLEVRPYGS